MKIRNHFPFVILKKDRGAPNEKCQIMSNDKWKIEDAANNQMGGPQLS